MFLFIDILVLVTKKAPAYKNLYQLSVKVFFHKIWSKKIRAQPANPTAPRNVAFKRVTWFVAVGGRFAASAAA